MNSFDILVIGAGPAGIFASLWAANSGLMVGLLEKNSSPGKKLLITASGQCNLTHREEGIVRGTIEEVNAFLSHYGGDLNSPAKSDKARFVKPCLFAYPPCELESFFTSKGVPLIVNEIGKVFPQSLKSRDILDTLIKECKKGGVVFIYNSPVTAIRKIQDGFEVLSGAKNYRARKVILTVGGRSFPATGSTGDGEVLAASFGHSIIPTRPMAAPVEIENFAYQNLAGISAFIELELFNGIKKVGSTRGDMLFTHTGISGPVVQNALRYMEPGFIFKINFAAASRELFDKKIIKAGTATGKLQVKTFLQNEGLSERLVLELLGCAGISRETKLAELDKKSRRALGDVVTSFTLVMKKAAGWDIAKITAGGVSTREVDANTMESRIVKGLYFAGEVLDVDGDTGGYNLQFSFSSGYVAGMSSAEKNDNDVGDEAFSKTEVLKKT